MDIVVTQQANDTPGDMNNDGLINFSDLLVLMQNYGKTCMPGANGDANGDGKVNFSDYLLFGQCFGMGGAASEEEMKAFEADSEVIQKEAEVVETAQTMVPCSSLAMAVMVGLGLCCFMIGSWQDRE
jgi:hypothetical protein